MNYNDYGILHLISALVMISFSYGAWTQSHLVGYGKHFRQVMTITCPPRLGWFLFELPNLVVVAYYLSIYKLNIQSTDTIAVALFTIHYINRDIIYPLRMSKFSKRVPIEVVVSAILYTVCNGYLQISSHVIDQSQESISLRTIIGLIIFIAGMTSNILCDSHLRQLKQKDGGYKIPQYGLFKYVTSAHYLSEIIEWFGYFLVSGRLSALIFLLNTPIILSQRALSSHKWYLNQFDNFPENRKALFPFLL